MVTSKRFHTSLVLLFISSIFAILGSFAFLSNINGIPHAFDYLGLADLISIILAMVAVFRLKNINYYFKYAFVSTLVGIGVSVTELTLAFFYDNLLMDAINTGLAASYELIIVLGSFLTIFGLRDCYKKDENSAKVLSNVFFYIILGIHVTVATIQIFASFDFFVQNYFMTMGSNILTYLLGVAGAVVLTICYSKAMNISYKTLKKIEQKGAQENPSEEAPEQEKVEEEVKDEK
ncbi:MAG: hypothetical protein K6F07_03075 [Bacilli bacterium]|nr:hypothetical protein [Bacilli bacterium]